MLGYFWVLDKVPVLSGLGPDYRRVLLLSGPLRLTEQPCAMVMPFEAAAVQWGHQGSRTRRQGLLSPFKRFYAWLHIHITWEM